MASTVTAYEASEQEIQNSILQYLTLKGYTCWRQNSSGIYSEKLGRFRKQSKYAVNGISDIIVLSDGKAYFIEVKRENGRQSEDQMLFQEFVERAGCEYFIARCLADVQEYGF